MLNVHVDSLQFSSIQYIQLDGVGNKEALNLTTQKHWSVIFKYRSACHVWTMMPTEMRFQANAFTLRHENFSSGFRLLSNHKPKRPHAYIDGDKINLHLKSPSSTSFALFNQMSTTTTTLKQFCGDRTHKKAHTRTHTRSHTCAHSHTRALVLLSTLT